MSRRIGIIPARGGSKRVPDKNLRSVGSKPLIGHAVSSAVESDKIDTVIVSSDDDRIRSKAEEFGAEAPFERPSELSTDSAQVQDVITHALEYYEELSESFNIVVMLLPTSPFRSPEDIDGTIDRLEESEATSSISLSSYQTPPYWAVETDDSGYLEEHFSEGVLWTDEDIPRSQDLPDLYHPNGAVFASDVTAWKQHETFYQPNTVGYKMPISRSLDVDTPEDLRLARGIDLADEMDDDNPGMWANK